MKKSITPNLLTARATFGAGIVVSVGGHLFTLPNSLTSVKKYAEIRSLQIQFESLKYHNIQISEKDGDIKNTLTRLIQQAARLRDNSVLFTKNLAKTSQLVDDSTMQVTQLLQKFQSYYLKSVLLLNDQDSIEIQKKNLEEFFLQLQVLCNITFDEIDTLRVLYEDLQQKLSSLDSSLFYLNNEILSRQNQINEILRALIRLNFRYSEVLLTYRKYNLALEKIRQTTVELESSFCADGSSLASQQTIINTVTEKTNILENNVDLLLANIQKAQCVYEEFSFQIMLFWEKRKSSVNKRKVLTEIFDGFFIIGGPNIQVAKDSSGLYTVHSALACWPKVEEKVYVKLPRPQLVQMQLPSQACPATCGGGVSGGVSPDTDQEIDPNPDVGVEVTTTKKPTPIPTTTKPDVTVPTPTTTVGVGTTTTLSPGNDIKTGVKCELFYPRRLGAYKAVQTLPTIDPDIFLVDIMPIGSGAYGGSSNGSEDVGKYLCFFIARQTSKGIELYNEGAKTFLTTKPSLDYSRGILQPIKVSYSPNLTDYVESTINGWAAIEISNPTRVRFPTTFFDGTKTFSLFDSDIILYLGDPYFDFPVYEEDPKEYHPYWEAICYSRVLRLAYDVCPKLRVEAGTKNPKNAFVAKQKVLFESLQLDIISVTGGDPYDVYLYFKNGDTYYFVDSYGSLVGPIVLTAATGYQSAQPVPIFLPKKSAASLVGQTIVFPIEESEWEQFNGYSICLALANTTLAEKYFLDSYIEAFCIPRTSCHAINLCDRYKNNRVSMPLPAVATKNKKYEATINVLNVGTENTRPGDFITFAVIWFDKYNNKKILTETDTFVAYPYTTYARPKLIGNYIIPSIPTFRHTVVFDLPPDYEKDTTANDIYLVIAIPGQVLDNLIRYFLCAPPTFNISRPTTTTSSPTTTSSSARPTTTTSTKKPTTTTTTTSTTPAPTTTTTTTTTSIPTTTTTTTSIPTTTTTSTTTTTTSTTPEPTTTEPPTTTTSIPTTTPEPELYCEKYVPYDLRIHTFYKWFDPIEEELCIYYQFLSKNIDTDIDWFIVDFQEDENQKLTDGSWADPETGALVKISTTKRHKAWKKDRLVQKTNKIGLSESLFWGVIRVKKQIIERFNVPLLIWGNGEVTKLGSSYYSSEEWVCNRGLEVQNNSIDLSYDDCSHLNYHKFSMQIVQESTSAVAKTTINLVFSDISRIPRPTIIETQMELDVFLYLVPKTFYFEGLRQNSVDKVFCVENFVVRQLGDVGIDPKTVAVSPFLTKTKFAGQDNIRLVLDPLSWTGLEPEWLHSMEVIIGVGNKDIETKYYDLSVKNTAQEEMFCANRVAQFGSGLKWDICSPYKHRSLDPVAKVKTVPQIVCNDYGNIEINLLVENTETEPNAIFDIFALIVKPNLTPEDGKNEEFGYLKADGTVVPILDWQDRWSVAEPLYSGKIKSTNRLPAFINYTYESLAKSYHKITYYVGKKQTVNGLYSIIEATCSIRGSCVVQLSDCFKYVTPTTLYFDYTGTKFVSPADNVNYYDSTKPHTGKENEFVWHKTINCDVTGNLADIGLYILNQKYFGKKMDVYLIYTQTSNSKSTPYFVRPDAQNKWVLSTDFANIVPVGSIILQEYNTIRYEIGSDPLRTIGGDLFPGGDGCSLTLWLGDNSAPTNSFFEAQCFDRKITLGAVYRQIVKHPEDRVVLLPLEPYRDSAGNWKNQNKNLVSSGQNTFPNTRYLQVGTAIDHSKDTESGVINGEESTYIYNDYLVMQNETEHHHKYWTENFPETSPYKNYNGWIHLQTSAIKQMYTPSASSPYSVIAWMHSPFGSIINEGHQDSICHRATDVDENWQKPYYFEQNFVRVSDVIEKNNSLWFSLIINRGHEELASVYFKNRIVATIKTNCFGFGENSVHCNSYLGTSEGNTIDFFVKFDKDNFIVEAKYDRVTKQTELVLPLHYFCGLVPSPTTTTKAPKPKCGATYIFDSLAIESDFIVGQNIERTHDIGIDGGAYFNFKPQYSLVAEENSVLVIRDANNTIIYQYEEKHNGLNFLLYSPTAALSIQFKNITSPDYLQYSLSCGFLSTSCNTSFLIPKTGYYPNGILIEASGNYAQVLSFQVGSDNKINPVTNRTDNSIVIGSTTVLNTSEYYFDNASVGELDFPVQNTGKNYRLNPKDFGFSSSYVSFAFRQCNAKNLQSITSSCAAPVEVEFQGDWENMTGRGGYAEFWHYLSGAGTFDLFVSSNSAEFSLVCSARAVNFSLSKTKMYDYATSGMAQFVLLKVVFLDWPSYLTYQFGCLNAPIRTTTPIPTTTTTTNSPTTTTTTTTSPTTTTPIPTTTTNSPTTTTNSPTTTTPIPTTTTNSPTTTTNSPTTTNIPTTTTKKPRPTVEDKLVLFDVTNNAQIFTISKLYDGNSEYGPEELFEFGMDHFNANIEIYENIEEWEQRLALAVFDNADNIIDWDYVDSDYCPLRGSYDSITWMYAG